ncbi:MgtC/SapB family protein [Fluviispira multicolorata]|uniref:MgtC/SapB family protein n=1 Tax=Fluviispira multicolorata TaxID=2654512 RepID=A0A833JDE0_9BACT|nr:MgtC/SapB family protein [Fluviispira multicolorata]KAB8028137.1 MgtC/SapB family protein [Fluviispira multicolorata]
MPIGVNLTVHYMPEIEILLFLLPKVGVALLVGTLVGIEREYRGKLAGIKTNALICAASALFTAVSLLMSDYGSSTPVHSADVTRIVAQIVSGIGFIGAGAIFKSSSKVQGLTTAAVIWTVSALGILVGFGIFLSTIIITIGLITFLSLIAFLEKKFFKSRSSRSGDSSHSGPGTLD